MMAFSRLLIVACKGWTLLEILIAFEVLLSHDPFQDLGIRTNYAADTTTAFLMQ